MWPKTIPLCSVQPRQTKMWDVIVASGGAFSTQVPSTKTSVLKEQWGLQSQLRISLSPVCA